ncbi:MAG: hypothetical protein K9L86_06135 [Candidatus Omnitrophica bacterium]|nr:hypothetical protein [Candidatus Omnitrophota bacterium]
MKKLIVLVVFFLPLVAFSNSETTPLSSASKNKGILVSKLTTVKSTLDAVSLTREEKVSPLEDKALVQEVKQDEKAKEAKTDKKTDDSSKPDQKATSGSEKIPVIVDADEIDFQRGVGKIYAKGNVKMVQKDVELYCDEGIFDVNTNIANITGNIKVIREGTVLYGETAVYDFNTYNADINNIRFESTPFYGEAPEGEKIGKNKLVMRNGYMTTCDLAEPHYRMVSKEVTIYPGDKVVARKVTLKVGKVPVFYIPYFSQSLKDTSFPAEIVPGHNDELGYFLLTRWRYQLNEEHTDWFNIDWYEERGWGFGLTHKMESKKMGKALARYYMIQDKLYQIGKRNSLFKVHGDRSGKADKYLEDDRYKAELSYDGEPIKNLSIIAEFHKFSDEFFVKDFFEEEYELNPNPKSYLLMRYPFQNSSLSLLTQKRFNRYESMSEYLPELSYDFFSQQLGNSKLYFNSSEKISNLAKKNANSDLDDDAFRFYGKNTLSYSDKIKWLSISPNIGLNSIYYSKNAFGDEDIWRIGFTSGTSLSSRLYKVFDVDWDIFGEEIDKVRHLITPEITYSYAHEPTVANANVFQFDGIDSLSRSETVSFVLSNKLQVKNKENEKWDFVYFSPALNYTINPEGANSRITTITADLEIYPKEGLSLTSNVTYDANSDGNKLGRITSFNLDFTTKGKYKVFEAGEEVEKERYSFTYGHRYTRVTDTQGTFDFSYQLTPKVKLGSYLRYEYNRGDLFEQQYKVRTDLHCWWLDLGLDVKRASVGGKNYTVWFEFVLKAFPSLSITFDKTHEGAKSQYYTTY